MPDTTNVSAAEPPAPQLQFFPSLGKILVLATVALFFGWVFAVALSHIPLPATGRYFLGALPGLLILARWIVHRPSLAANAQGVTLCGFDFSSRFVAWKTIKSIELEEFTSRHDVKTHFLAIHYISVSETGIKLRKKTRISELLLPVPVTSVMLQLTQTFSPQIKTNYVMFSPGPEPLQEMETRQSHPWVWSWRDILAAMPYGVVIGVPFGIATGIAYRFIPSQQGAPANAAVLIFFLLMFGQMGVGPFIYAAWLLPRWHGNRVPALAASISASCIMLVLLSLLSASHLWLGLIILMIPIQTFFLWLAAPIGDRNINAVRRSRLRDALRDNNEQRSRRRGRRR